MALNVPATNLITGADLTAYAPDLDLSQFGGASGATVSGIIAQASGEIISLCNVKGFDYALETNETARVAISSMGELYINFQRRPVAVGDVVSISLVKGGFSTSLTLTDSSSNVLYQIPNNGVSLMFPSSYLAAAGTLILGGSTQLVTMKGADVFYKVSYYGGYQNGIPADLKRACVLWVRDIIATQFNATGANSFTQGSYSVSYNTNADGDSMLIKRAKGIINQGGYARWSTFG